MWWIVALALAFGGLLVLVGIVLVVRNLGGKKKPPQDDLDDFGPAPSVVAEELPSPTRAPEPVPAAPAPPEAPDLPPTPRVAPPDREAAPAGDAGVEAPDAPPDIQPPAAGTAVTPEPASAAPGPKQELIQKLRFSDADLVVRAWRIVLAGEPLYAFSTEGYVRRGGSELVLYLDADPGLDVIETLKRFTGFALAELERGVLPTAGALLRFSAPLGHRRIAGFLAVAAQEPEAVDFGEHVVLLAVDPDRFYLGADGVREALTQDGRLPWVSREASA